MNNSGAQAYNKFKNYFNEHLLDFIPEIDDISKELYNAMKYSLLAGGKRLRPVLILAAYEMCESKLSFALPFACAAEYIHTYSLIHDDLPAMDNDDLRRGQPTNHKVFGEDIAILAGDGLLSSAYEAMSKYMLLYLDDPELIKRLIRAQYCLVKGTGVQGMVAGQVADVLNEGKEFSSGILHYIHYNKTAAFIRACVKCGAFLGGADKTLLHDLEIYGENVGLAFQIVDDILDVTSSVEQMGHSIGKDAEEGKCTYPALYGLNASKDQAFELLTRARDAISKYYDNAEVFEYIIQTLEEKIK